MQRRVFGSPLWPTTKMMIGLGLIIASGTAVVGAQTIDVRQPQDSAPVNQSTLASHVTASYGQLPLSFEANVGQADPSIDFLARGQGYSVSLASNQVVLSSDTPAVPGTVWDQASVEQGANSVRLTLLGANLHGQSEARDLLPGRINYLIGNDPTHWRTNVPTYASVAYPAAYPGIDLVYDGNQGQLEYTFVIAPGGDPGVIRFDFDADRPVAITADGDLVVETASGDLHQPAPVLYQELDGSRQPISGGYATNADGSVGFEVGDYDSTRPLIIDPVLVYSTFLGGSSGANAAAIALAPDGAAYITGTTASSDFPVTPGAAQPVFVNKGLGAAFVSKLNPSGTALIYSTFLGNGAGESATAIAVNAAGEAHVAGLVRGGVDGVFVIKLNSTGTAVMYAVRLSGGILDTVRAIAVDSIGNAFITGESNGGFPVTPGAFQTTHGGNANVFVTKLNPTGSLVYSTYLGNHSGQFDQGFGIAIDAADNAYVAGGTLALDFPTTPGAFRRSSGVGGQSAFVSKLNATGTALVYSTFLGGGEAHSLTVDAAGNAYVTGRAFPTDFAITPGAFQRVTNQPSVFVTKLNVTGTALVYSSLFAGTLDESPSGNAIALDSLGNAYVTGVTSAPDFPTTPDAFQTAFGGGAAGDAFVTKLNSAGTALVYSSFLGGKGNDQGNGIAVDPVGNAYVVGQTDSSPDFPTTVGAFQTVQRGRPNGFVVKIGPQVPPQCRLSGSGTNAGGQKFIQITTQDANSGLRSIEVTEATNATIPIPAFTQGTHLPVVVTATKVNQAVGAVVALRVTNQAGQFTECDPGLVTVGRGAGESPVQVLHHVARGESHLTVVNGTPGVDRLRLIVNGQRFEVTNLHDGETRELDISAALRKETRNTLLVLGLGPRNSSAMVIVSDSLPAESPAGKTQ